VCILLLFLLTFIKILLILIFPSSSFAKLITIIVFIIIFCIGIVSIGLNSCMVTIYSFILNIFIIKLTLRINDKRIRFRNLIGILKIIGIVSLVNFIFFYFLFMFVVNIIFNIFNLFFINYLLADFIFIFILVFFFISFGPSNYFFFIFLIFYLIFIF
jgi:hypothetical protein